MSRLVPRVACVLALACGPAATARAQDSSAALAKQLVTVMSSSGLDAIAARDPETPDRAIAALAFPGSQLLVVSAPYPDKATLDAYLANHMYRDVYTALQQPSITTGKVFYQDLGCDGLAAADGGVDIMYENGKTQTIFDGDWKKQKLSQAEYAKRLKDADTRYAHLLSALLPVVQTASAKK